MTEMMKCGHAANARTAGGEPVCAICVGIVPGARVIDEDPPKLEGRKAQCVYSRGRDGRPCGKVVDSSADLPFFGSNPKGEMDNYYCGCWGWD